MLRTDVLHGHQINDGRGGALLLYLPTGVAVTDQHLRDIGFALRGVRPDEMRLMGEFDRQLSEIRMVLGALDGDLEMARLTLRLSAQDGTRPEDVALMVRRMRSEKPDKTPLPLPG
jgi:hypothetical protein